MQHPYPVAYCLMFMLFSCAPDAAPSSSALQPVVEAAAPTLDNPSGSRTQRALAGNVKIAVMGPLTGPASGYGQSQLNGVRLAAEEINAKQGEGRLHVELVVVDDEGNMSASGDRLVKLVYEDKVNAIIGAINSSVTHVVEMVCAKTRVPMITTTSTDPSITRTGTYWAFRCLADDLLQGQALAHRIFEVDGHKNVFILMQNNRYGKMGGREIARIATESGHPPLAVRVFDGKAAHWPDEVRGIATANPDAIVLWGLYNPCGRLISELRQGGIEAPVYGADGMVHPAFLEQAGLAAEGAIVTLPFDPCRNHPTTRHFLEKYLHRFGEPPDSFAAHSYDAMMIIWEAIQRGKCTDRTCIKDNMLLTHQHDGVTGFITLDKEGNDTRSVDLAQVIAGKLVPLSLFQGRSVVDIRREIRETLESPGTPPDGDHRSSGWVYCPAPLDNP